jgi:hypothetical protein
LALPSFAGVEAEKQRKAAGDRSAEEDSEELAVKLQVIAASELEGVEGAPRIGVGEDEFPGMAGVIGFVEAGDAAVACRHHNGAIPVKRLNGPEVEARGAGGNGAGEPVGAVVSGAEHCRAGTACPGSSTAYAMDSVEVGEGVGVLDLPLAVRAVHCSEQE